MAVERLGVYSLVPADDVWSTNITVPSGTDLAVCFIGGYEGGSDTIFSSGLNFSIGGISGTWAARSTSTADCDDIAVLILANPLTGSQTFAGYYSPKPTLTTTVVLVFYAGVDTASPIMASAGADSNNATSLTVSGLSTTTGSYTVMGSVCDNAAPVVTGAGQTQIYADTTSSYVWTAVAEKAEASSMTASYLENSFPALVAISIRPTSGAPPSTESPAAIMMGL